MIQSVLRQAIPQLGLVLLEPRGPPPRAARAAVHSDEGRALASGSGTPSLGSQIPDEPFSQPNDGVVRRHGAENRFAHAFRPRAPCDERRQSSDAPLTPAASARYGMRCSPAPIALGPERAGFTLFAPAGTISRMMDWRDYFCIEPELAWPMKSSLEGGGLIRTALAASRRRRSERYGYAPALAPRSRGTLAVRGAFDDFRCSAPSIVRPDHGPAYAATGTDLEPRPPSA